MEISQPIKYKIVGQEKGFVVKTAFDAEEYYQNLDRKKLVIDYAKFENTLNPQFIPTLRASALTAPPPPATGGDTVNTEFIGLLTPNITNYFLFVTRKPTSSQATTSNGIANIQWSQPDVSIPTPPLQGDIPQKYYLNKYYQIDRFTHFLDMIQVSAQNLFNAMGGISLGKTFQFVLNQYGISLQIDKFLTDNYYFYMNEELIRVLGFKKALYLPILTGGDQKFYGLELINQSLADIGGVDCLIASNEFISNYILPYDEIIVASNLPLINEEQHSNVLTGGRQTNKSYKNVILSFFPESNNPINTMPKFIYTTESSNTKYHYFNAKEFNDSLFLLDVYLYNSRLDIAIPYILDKDETIIIEGRVIMNLSE